VSVSITASNDTPVSVVDAINLVVDEAAANTLTGYDANDYPASPAVTYYISIEKTGEDSLVSPVFTPSASEGAYEWASVIIPASGEWTAHLRLTADDSSVATDTITAT
jgi:hypothetical protein